MSGQPSERIDLLVHGGDVLTVDEAGTVVPDGAVAVRDGEIVAVGPAAELTTRFTADESLDASNCLVLPGLVNTHTHLAMTLLRGRADDVTLQGFLERVLKWEAQLLSPQNVAAAVRVAVAESVRSGVTSALDMYWFHKAAEQAARETGWRLHTGPTFMDVPEPPDRIAYEDRLAWARQDLAARGAPRPGHRPILFAHSTYTLSPSSSSRSLPWRESSAPCCTSTPPRTRPRSPPSRCGTASAPWNSSTRSDCSAPTCCWPTPWT